MQQLAFNMLMWTISWVSLCTIVVAVSVPSDVARGLKVAFGVNMSFIILTYVMGFFLTRTPAVWVRELGWSGYVTALVCQVLGIPLYTYIEGGAVVFWMVTALPGVCRETTDAFELVQKERPELVDPLVPPVAPVAPAVPPPPC